MKRCLDENQLMQLWTAEPAEYPELRAHLTQCARCTAGYQQLASDAGTITEALTTAADHLKWRDRAATHGAYGRLGNRVRTAAIFSGAAVFGGAAAFALMVTLGWHRPGASAQLAQASANLVVATDATISGTTAKPAIVGDAGTIAVLNTGSLYAVDALTSDSLAALAYGSAAQSGNLNADDDLLFCVPGDDSAICESSAEQG